MRLASAAVGLAIALVAPPSASAASATDVTRVWQTQIGTAGAAILVLWRSGEGNVRVALRGLRPNARYSVSIYTGSCGALGPRLTRTSQDLSVSPDGATKQALYLSSAQMRQIRAAGQVSIAVGSVRRCGSFPIRPKSCASPAAQIPWKNLVLIYPETNLTYRAADGSSVAFASAFNADEIARIKASAAAVPALVGAWSRGTASTSVRVAVATHPLRSLSYVWNDGYALDDADARQDFAALAPFGAYDSITVVWKAWNDQGQVVPAFAQTWGNSIWTSGAAFASMPEFPNGAVVTSESLIAIWLAGVDHYYATFGYRPIPDLFAYGNGAYAPDATGSMAAYYSDFMTGHVHDAQGTSLGGITPAMWRSGTPASRPISCLVVC